MNINQEVITMYEDEFLTVEEIASALEITSNQVKYIVEHYAH